MEPMQSEKFKQFKFMANAKLWHDREQAISGVVTDAVILGAYFSNCIFTIMSL